MLDIAKTTKTLGNLETHDFTFITHMSSVEVQGPLIHTFAIFKL